MVLRVIARIADGMKNGGIQNVEDVTLTSQQNKEMTSLLKERMKTTQYFFPFFTWETSYRSEYVAELNVERYTLTKDRVTRFNHPAGTHDDTFWVTALAVSATMETKTTRPNSLQIRLSANACSFLDVLYDVFSCGFEVLEERKQQMNVVVIKDLFECLQLIWQGAA